MVLEKLGYDSGGDLAADMFLGASDWQRAGEGVDEGDWGKLLSGAALGTLAVGSLLPTGLMTKGGRAALQAKMAPRMGDDFVDGALGANLGGGGGAPPAPQPRAPVRDELTERFLNPQPDIARQGRQALPDPLGLGDTGFGSVPGEVTGQMSRDLAARGPVGLEELSRPELSKVIRETDEFQRLFRMERDLTSASGDLLGLDGRGARAELHAWAKAAGLKTPPDTMSTGALENGLFRRVLRGEDKRAADNIAQRLQNASRFLSESAYEPSYYRNYHNIIRSASEAQGLPDMPVNVALSTASAQASPFEEVQRLFDIAPFMRAEKGRAVFDEAAAKTAGFGESFHKQTGRAFAETLNNPDYLSRKVSGQAAKTHAYTSLRHDPEFAAIYVADTVDGLGQFWVPGRNVGTSSPKVARWNQLSGRVLAEAYGVPPAWMQESLWNPIRVAREGSRGKGRGLRDAFSGRLPGSGEPVPIDVALQSALRRVPDDVKAVGRRSYEDFVSSVRSGENARWAWDESRARPVFRSVDDMLPPSSRGTTMSKAFREKWDVDGGKHEVMQRQALEASAALGENIRSKLAAFSAATGVPVAVLLAILAGEDGSFSGRGEVEDADVEATLAAMDDAETGWV